MFDALSRLSFAFSSVGLDADDKRLDARTRIESIRKRGDTGRERERERKVVDGKTLFFFFAVLAADLFLVDGKK